MPSSQPCSVVCISPLPHSPAPNSFDKQEVGIWVAYPLPTQASLSALAENHRPNQIASLNIFSSRRCQPVAAPSSSPFKIDKLRHPQRGRHAPLRGPTVIRSELASTHRRPAHFISGGTTEAIRYQDEVLTADTTTGAALYDNLRRRRTVHVDARGQPHGS